MARKFSSTIFHLNGFRVRCIVPLKGNAKLRDKNSSIQSQGIFFFILYQVHRIFQKKKNLDKFLNIHQTEIFIFSYIIIIFYNYCDQLILIIISSPLSTNCFLSLILIILTGLSHAREVTINIIFIIPNYYITNFVI